MTAAAVAIESPVSAGWLTPRRARLAPVHRWFVFPHTYAPELVGWLIDELAPAEGARLLDPFCGAGTTLVEGQRRGYNVVGIDLLPLAVLASRAKLARPQRDELALARRSAVEAARSAGSRTPPSSLLRRAFTPTAFGRLSASLASATGPSSDCVRVATLSVAPRFASLVADGGWLRMTTPDRAPRSVSDALDEALSAMEDDVALESRDEAGEIHLADARRLPLQDSSVDIVVTSPPYPNRHDYTRVFAVELELGFGLGDAVKHLRYAALRSHPEARNGSEHPGYRRPRGLRNQVAEIAANHPDPRIPRMLDGYFRDLYSVLRELHRVLTSDGRAALVVGNAQYVGVSVPVDKHVAALARRAGFSAIDIIPLRLRGNSAQQMATFGRQPSRESAVLLRR